MKTTLVILALLAATLLVAVNPRAIEGAWVDADEQTYNIWRAEDGYAAQVYVQEQKNGETVKTPVDVIDGLFYNKRFDRWTGGTYTNPKTEEVSNCAAMLTADKRLLISVYTLDANGEESSYTITLTRKQ